MFSVCGRVGEILKCDHSNKERLGFCFCVFGSIKRFVKKQLFHFAFMKELQKVSAKEEYITRTLK